MLPSLGLQQLFQSSIREVLLSIVWVWEKGVGVSWMIPFAYFGVFGDNAIT